MDLLAPILSWILDRIITTMRRTLGNRGCFLASIVAAIVLVGFLSAYYLHGQGEDWRTWLVVGPLATVVLVVMVTATYGLARGSKSKTDETPLGEVLGDQELAAWSATEELATQDIRTMVREIPRAILRLFQAETAECPHCGQEISSRAIICKFCDRYVNPPRSEPTPRSGPRPASTTSPSPEPVSELNSAGHGEPLVRCEHCGARNPADSSFCGECGASLESARIAQEVTPQPEGAAHELQEEEAEPGGPPGTLAGNITPMRIVYGAAILSALVAALLSYSLAPKLFIEWFQGAYDYLDYISIFYGLDLLVMAVVNFPFCIGGARAGYAIERGFRGERASGLSALPGAVLGGIMAFVVGIVLFNILYLFAHFGG